METEPIKMPSIRDSVNRLLAGYEDKKIVFIAHADLESAKVAIMVNLGDHWDFRGYLDKPYKGQLEGGAEVIFSL